MSLLRIVHFTDPHLFGGAGESLRGIATLPALQATLARARATDWPPDAVLVTGDLVNDDAAGYRQFRRVFADLGVPVMCLPGNHDVPDAMRHELAGPPFLLEGHVDMKGWRIVLLDSQVADAAHGFLGARALQVLEEALATAGGRHCLVCLHHHPVPMGSRWLDTVGLANAAAFWERIDRHAHVRAVLWGHVHQDHDSQRGSVRLLATPSTCAQFLPGSDDFAIDERPPGFRTLTLGDDGTVVTEVMWLGRLKAGSARSACSAA
jgi:Icc protein